MEKPSECSICMSPFSTGPPECLSALKCGHVFHDNCILTWKRISKDNLKCPLCRLESKGTLKLYLRISEPTATTILSNLQEQSSLEGKDLIISQLGDKLRLLEDEIDLLRMESLNIASSSAIENVKIQHKEDLKRIQTHHERQMLKEKQLKTSLLQELQKFKEEKIKSFEERETLITLKVSKYIQDIIDHPSIHCNTIFNEMEPHELKNHAINSYKMLFQKEKEIKENEKEISHLKFLLERRTTVKRPPSPSKKEDSLPKFDIPLHTISFFNVPDGVDEVDDKRHQQKQQKQPQKLQIPPSKMQKLKDKKKSLFY